MHRPSPADELAEIRREIARLKAREARLRAAFLKDPDHGAVGRWSRVEVEFCPQSRFDSRLLPAAILSDPAYRRETLVPVVRCLPVQPAAAPRPGWPIRRDAVRHWPNAPLHVALGSVVQ